MKRFLMVPYYIGILISAVLFFCSGFGGTARGDVLPIEQNILTREEKQWLNEHPRIKIGIRDTPPLVMKDKKNSSFYGLGIDYIRILERRLGVKFEIVHFATWRELIERARKREVDVLVTAVWTPDRSTWLNYTRPYIILINKIIVRSGTMGEVESIEQLRGKRVGVLDGSAIHDYMKRYQGLLTVVPLRDEPRALADASFGAIDAAVMDIARASYYIQKENITNLVSVGNINYNYEYGFSSRKDWPLLNGILEKGLASIPQEERDVIYHRWILPLSPPVSILKTRTFWLSMLGSGMVVFTIMVLLWNRALQRRIQQNTAELSAANEKLRQSQKMEAIGQLAGGIAHDFNNILTVIIGYGQLLRAKISENASLLLYVENILEAANRAAHLTRDLLAFSRRQILNPRPVDLNESIERVKALLRTVIVEDIELKTICNRRPLMVNADSSQIELVLINLATNARDAMPRGGTFTIETGAVKLNDAFVRTHGFGEAGEFALISVTDTGTGMDEKTRAKIFEPFFTTKEVGKGTGLGLSMVYGVVKQHQGNINFSSEPGKGTTFSIYLPLLTTEQKMGKTPAAAHVETLCRGTETVLIAEDDKALRKLSRITLEEAGYRVIEAENGEDALNEFSRHQDTIRLVILDMIMPGKSGMETYKEIRKMRPDVRVLFISGYTADKFGRDEIQRDALELLQKPISPRTLLENVREILDKK